MSRILKFTFWLLLFIALVVGIASMFPATAEFLDQLPYWVLCPLRICAAIFLVIMFIGYLANSGILQRYLGKK